MQVLAYCLYGCSVYILILLHNFSSVILPFVKELGLLELCFVLKQTKQKLRF